MSIIDSTMTCVVTLIETMLLAIRDALKFLPRDKPLTAGDLISTLEKAEKWLEPIFHRAKTGKNQ